MKIKHGFTLIELLIVVAIIAILAAIAVPNFLEAQVRAKVSRARADMRTEATALESYNIDFNAFPRQFDAFTHPTPYFTRGNWHEHIPSTLTTPVSYLSTIPLDPFKPLTPYPPPNPKAYVQGRHFYFATDFSIKALGLTSGGVYNFYKKTDNLAGKYVIFSYGPDRIYYNEPVTGTGMKTEGQYIDYDSTNGTLSKGNIIRSQKNGERFGGDKSILGIYG